MMSSSLENSFYLKKSSLVILFSFLFFTGQTQRAYIIKYKPIAQQLSNEFGIPLSVILGIAIVESSAGTARNCRLLNNHFGIVGKNNLRKTKGIKTRYKQYPDAAASYRDFCKLIAGKKFYAKLNHNAHYLIWLDKISKTGYSEAPEVWKKRIAGVIKKNKLA